jgi:hypothetical protein
LRRGAPVSERLFAAGVGAMLVVGVVARIYIDYGAFAQAAYRSEDVGPFTIYYRPGSTSTGSTP